MNKNFFRGALAVFFSLVCTSGWAAAPAPHSHPSEPDQLPHQATQSEQALQRFETQTLGAQHAADHARARIERQNIKPVTRSFLAQNLDDLKGYLRELAGDQTLPAGLQQILNGLIGSAKAAAGTPDQVGQWSSTISIPVIGIHTVLLPTGKVLFFSYQAPKQNGAGNQGVAYLWNPADNTGRLVPPPNNIWCAGLTLLADGRVLVAGGNLLYSTGTFSDSGLQQLSTFNPFTEIWTLQNAMLSQGRWYPTLTTLADGRVVILSGLSELGDGAINQDVEIFTPDTDIDGPNGTLQPAGQRSILGLYPHQFLMPDGNMLLAGPHPFDTALFNPSTFAWTDIPNLNVNRYLYGSGVLLPGGPNGSNKVMLIGGGDGNSATVTATTEMFDAANPGAGWSFRASLPQPRGNNNTVILPDGMLLTVGGNSNAQLYPNPEKEAELYNPATNTWSAMATQAEDRAYHSTAILLPDARVLSAGDDGAPANSARYTNDAIEIFSPTYLFRGGPRPIISAAPATITWGQNFTITTPSSVTQAVLIAPGATTHGNDMHQRYVPLVFTGSGSLSATAPPNANVAPPGYYMLFLLNSAGVPSVSKWIRLIPASGASSFQFNSATFNVAEEAGTATITVSRSGGTGAASVDFTTGGGTSTAGTDYTATSGILSFAPGEITPKTFTVTINDDSFPEPIPNETINLTLSNPSAGDSLGGQSSAVLTITDNDSAPPTLQFGSAAYTVNETSGTAMITVTRTGAINTQVSVNYATSNGSAVAGQDYTATSGTLTFLANDIAESFPVLITVDSTVETDETVNLTLSNASGGGAVLGTPTSALLTITNRENANEAPATPPGSGGGSVPPPSGGGSVPPPANGGGGGGGGGGCSLNNQSAMDPLLPLLVLMAGLALAWRRGLSRIATKR